MKISVRRAFTLIEVITVISILSVLVFVGFVVLRPFDRVRDSQTQRALTELAEIAKATQLFALDYGYYPADVSRDLPAGIAEYITPEADWPEGPFPGSVYDYDNWSDQECIDPNGSYSVQITLREVPNQNPDGTDVWAWYYPIFGNGTPHCSNNNEYTKGECVICPGFDPTPVN